MLRPKTLFLDIDGTLVYHSGDIVKQYADDLNILPGVLDKFKDWDKKGYIIILTTGRRESGRVKLEEQLNKLGIFYDRLIMGIGGGKRIIINDLKDDSDELTAEAITIKRNVGLEGVNI
jgi:hypothetical protein